MATQTLKTVIVGGGWSGLAAAATLSRYGMPVELFEAGKLLGGRARSVVDDEWQIDNGQHILFGAYHNTLELFRTLGVAERKVLKRELLRLEVHGKHDEVVLQVHNVAAPMHLLWGVMRAKGLDLHERGTALRLGARLSKKRFTIKQDLPLEKWLLQNGQTRRLIQYLWRPLCLATLNTPIQEASTQLFLHTLRKHFAREREDSDLLFVLPNLSNSLPLHAQKFIERQGGSIHLRQRITGLAVNGNRLSGFYCGETFHRCDRLILATPPWVSQDLLAQHTATLALSDQLGEFHYHPICTVYLQYPDSVRLGSEMIGLVDSIGHWLFDRGINGQPGLLALVICGPGQHMIMDNESLVEAISAELAERFPHWPAPLKWRVLREKRATFGCETDIQQKRPETETGIAGLWLAGDYLNTGYPATLEGAVKSGIMAAKALLTKVY